MANMIGYEAQTADMCGVSSAPLEAAVKGFVKRVLASDVEAVWYFATRMSEGRMVRAQNTKNVDCNSARKMVDYYENLFHTSASLAEVEERYKTGR